MRPSPQRSQNDGAIRFCELLGSAAGKRNIRICIIHQHQKIITSASSVNTSSSLAIRPKL